MSNRPNSKRISASHFALRPMSDTMLSDFLDLMKIKMASITIQMPIVIGNTNGRNANPPHKRKIPNRALIIPLMRYQPLRNSGGNIK